MRRSPPGRRGKRSSDLRSGACCLPKPRASSPKRTGSCATSSTGCSTSTTRSATTCRRNNRIARASQRWPASLPGRLFPPACNRCAVRSRAISRACSPSAIRKPRRGPIIGASSWAAEFVTRHPLLLDELLDDRLLYAPPDLDAFARELRSQLAARQGDTERRMNLLREMHQAQVFRLLAQDLAGLLSVERLADHLSALADLVLAISLEQVWSELRGRHLEGAPRFAVISYGKLGGKELGYASDLDIIFLYDDAHEQVPETYARLAQRFNHWLTSRTSAGALFDTDLRLRPSGAAGLLVSPVEAFARYQEHDAWVWEHQALSRARYSAGDSRVGEAFEAIRERVLKRKRDLPVLAREILSMREKMHAAHPNKSGLFDVKHDAGGMIDIEFTVQYLVLARAHEFPALTKN